MARTFPARAFRALIIRAGRRSGNHAPLPCRMGSQSQRWPIRSLNLGKRLAHDTSSVVIPWPVADTVCRKARLAESGDVSERKKHTKPTDARGDRGPDYGTPQMQRKHPAIAVPTEAAGIMAAQVVEECFL